MRDEDLSARALLRRVVRRLEKRVEDAEKRAETVKPGTATRSRIDTRIAGMKVILDEARAALDEIDNQTQAKERRLYVVRDDLRRG